MAKKRYVPYIPKLLYSQIVPTWRNEDRIRELLLEGKTILEVCDITRDRPALVRRVAYRLRDNEGFVIPTNRPAKVIKNCKHCATPFRVDRSHREFCSHACYRANVTTVKEYVCKMCHSTFRFKKERFFCSRACYDKGRPLKLSKPKPSTRFKIAPCRTCQQPFKKSLYEFDHGRKYCSRACYDIGRRKEFKVAEPIAPTA